MNMSSGIITGDGLTVWPQLSEVSVALAFADSPFNMGDDDDVDNDRRDRADDLSWTEKWLRVLSLDL